MNIAEFAIENRLKIRLDPDDDTTVVLGKAGHIYEHSIGELGVMFITPVSKAPRTGTWNRLSAACVTAGMVLNQNGDAEGSLIFDPTIPEQVRLAIRLAAVKRKRRPSAAQIVNLSKGIRFQKHDTTTIEGHIST